MTTLTKIERKSSSLKLAEQRRYVHDLIRYITDDKTLDPIAKQLLDESFIRSGTMASERSEYASITRVAFTSSRSLLADDPQAIVAEFNLLVDLRAQQKDAGQPRSSYVEHWVLSWLPGEEPTDLQLEKSIDVFASQMGFAEYQLLCVAHRDTEAFHLHIAANRIHPESLKLVSIASNFDKAQKVTALLDHEFDWTPAPNARYAINGSNQLVYRSKLADPEEAPPIPKAAALSEHLNGMKSVATLAIEVAGPVIKKAKTWEELHAGLAQKGFIYTLKGSGAVLGYLHQKNEAVATEPVQEFVKASAAGAFASRSKLEKRLGKFVPPKLEIAPKVAKAPEPLDSISLIPSIEDEFRNFQRQRKLQQEKVAKRKQRTELLQQQRERIRREEAEHLAHIRQLKQHEGIEPWRSRVAREYVKQIRKAELRQVIDPLPVGQPKALDSFRKYLQLEQPELYPLYRRARGYQIKRDNWLVPVSPHYVPINPDKPALEFEHFRAEYNPEKQSIDYYRIKSSQAYEQGSNLVHETRHQPAFSDQGQLVSVSDYSLDSVQAALELAQTKFGQVWIIGQDPQFLTMVVEVAARHDFNFIDNPDLREQIQQRRAILAPEAIRSIYLEPVESVKTPSSSPVADQSTRVMQNDHLLPNALLRPQLHSQPATDRAQSDKERIDEEGITIPWSRYFIIKPLLPELLPDLEQAQEQLAHHIRERRQWIRESELYREECQIWADEVDLFVNQMEKVEDDIEDLLYIRQLMGLAHADKVQSAAASKSDLDKMPPTREAVMSLTPDDTRYEGALDFTSDDGNAGDALRQSLIRNYHGLPHDLERFLKDWGNSLAPLVIELDAVFTAEQAPSAAASQVDMMMHTYQQVWINDRLKGCSSLYTLSSVDQELLLSSCEEMLNEKLTRHDLAPKVDIVLQNLLVHMTAIIREPPEVSCQESRKTDMTVLLSSQVELRPRHEIKHDRHYDQEDDAGWSPPSPFR